MLVRIQLGVPLDSIRWSAYLHFMPGPEKQQGKTFTCRSCGRDFVFKRTQSMTTRCCGACYLANRHFRLMNRVWEYMGGRKCSRCGYNKTSRALEFHHVDPKTKKFSIGGNGPITRYKWDTVQEELDKCIVLCRNCHAEIHEEKALVKPGPWQIWRVFHEGDTVLHPLGDNSAVVKDFLSSELTRNEFCRDRSVRTRDLANWLREFWSHHVVKYRQGTLNCGEYCDNHGLEHDVFHRWRRKLIAKWTAESNWEYHLDSHLICSYLQ
jgi:hypothetical protein